MSILHFKIQILEQFGSSRETNVKGSRVTSIEHQRPFMLLKKLRKKERKKFMLSGLIQCIFVCDG